MEMEAVPLLPNKKMMVLVHFLPDGEVRKESWALLLEEYEYLALQATQNDPGFNFLKISYLRTIIRRKTGYEVSLAEYAGRAPKRVIRQGKIESSTLSLDSVKTFELALVMS